MSGKKGGMPRQKTGDGRVRFAMYAAQTKTSSKKEQNLERIHALPQNRAKKEKNGESAMYAKKGASWKGGQRKGDRPVANG